MSQTNTHLALLIVQHQPLYRDLAQTTPCASYREPWVRLYGVKDYYALAAILAEHPRVQATFALLPSLVWQLLDYADHGATDLDFELSATPVHKLSTDQRAELSRRLFRVSFERQVLPSSRFTQLYSKRLSGEVFDEQDLTDLQVLSNLSWVSPALREGRVTLPDGFTFDLRPLVTQDEGFQREHVDRLLEVHQRLLANVVPLYRKLSDLGQIELATGPFYSPVLPLLWNSENAVIDRTDASLPAAVRRPGDVREQVSSALVFHETVFGQRPVGLWPPEGALCSGVVEVLEEQGFEWTVVAKSALQPTREEAPDWSDTSLLTHPWQAPTAEGLAVFPRESWLSEHLENLYAHEPDYAVAAHEALQTVESAVRFGEPDAFEDEIVTAVVSGDHPWTAYRHNGVEFLRALFGELTQRTDLATTTFSGYLHGTEDRAISPHPVAALPGLAALRCTSQRDELGSAPGSDLGAWIGERQENEAWQLLCRVAAEFDAVPDAANRFPLARQSLLAAEEAETFAFLGDDTRPPVGARAEQVALFRLHLTNVYRLSNREPPAWLASWTPAQQAGTGRDGYECKPVP